MSNDDFSLFGCGEYVRDKTTKQIWRVLYGPEIATCAGTPIYIFEHAHQVQVLDKNSFEANFEATGKPWTEIT